MYLVDSFLALENYAAIDLWTVLPTLAAVLASFGTLYVVFRTVNVLCFKKNKGEIGMITKIPTIIVVMFLAFCCTFYIVGIILLQLSSIWRFENDYQIFELLIAISIVCYIIAKVFLYIFWVARTQQSFKATIYELSKLSIVICFSFIAIVAIVTILFMFALAYWNNYINLFFPYLPIILYGTDVIFILSIASIFLRKLAQITYQHIKQSDYDPQKRKYRYNIKETTFTEYKAPNVTHDTGTSGTGQESACTIMEAQNNDTGNENSDKKREKNDQNQSNKSESTHIELEAPMSITGTTEEPQLIDDNTGIAVIYKTENHNDQNNNNNNNNDNNGCRHIDYLPSDTMDTIIKVDSNIFHASFETIDEQQETRARLTNGDTIDIADLDKIAKMSTVNLQMNGRQYSHVSNVSNMSNMSTDTIIGGDISHNSMNSMTRTWDGAADIVCVDHSPQHDENGTPLFDDNDRNGMHMGNIVNENEHDDDMDDTDIDTSLVDSEIAAIANDMHASDTESVSNNEKNKNGNANGNANDNVNGKTSNIKHHQRAVSSIEVGHIPSGKKSKNENGNENEKEEEINEINENSVIAGLMNRKPSNRSRSKNNSKNGTGQASVVNSVSLSTSTMLKALTIDTQLKKENENNDNDSNNGNNGASPNRKVKHVRINTSPTIQASPKIKTRFPMLSPISSHPTKRGIKYDIAFAAGPSQNSRKSEKSMEERSSTPKIESMRRQRNQRHSDFALVTTQHRANEKMKNEKNNSNNGNINVNNDNNNISDNNNSNNNNNNNSKNENGQRLKSKSKASLKSKSKPKSKPKPKLKLKEKRSKRRERRERRKSEKDRKKVSISLDKPSGNTKEMLSKFAMILEAHDENVALENELSRTLESGLRAQSVSRSQSRSRDRRSNTTATQSIEPSHSKSRSMSRGRISLSKSKSKSNKQASKQQHSQQQQHSRRRTTTLGTLRYNNKHKRGSTGNIANKKNKHNRRHSNINNTIHNDGKDSNNKNNENEDDDDDDMNELSLSNVGSPVMMENYHSASINGNHGIHNGIHHGGGSGAITPAPISRTSLVNDATGNSVEDVTGATVGLTTDTIGLFNVLGLQSINKMPTHGYGGSVNVPSKATKGSKGSKGSKTVNTNDNNNNDDNNNKNKNNNDDKDKMDSILKSELIERKSTEVINEMQASETLENLTTLEYNQSLSSVSVVSDGNNRILLPSGSLPTSKRNSQVKPPESSNDSIAMNAMNTMNGMNGIHTMNRMKEKDNESQEWGDDSGENENTLTEKERKQSEILLTNVRRDIDETKKHVQFINLMCRTSVLVLISAIASIMSLTCFIIRFAIFNSDNSNNEIGHIWTRFLFYLHCAIILFECYVNSLCVFMNFNFGNHSYQIWCRLCDQGFKDCCKKCFSSKIVENAVDFAISVRNRRNSQSTRNVFSNSTHIDSGNSNTGANVTAPDDVSIAVQLHQ